MHYVLLFRPMKGGKVGGQYLFCEQNSNKFHSCQHSVRSSLRIPFWWINVCIWTNVFIWHTQTSHFYISRDMIKKKKKKWHVSPAKTQISLGFRPVWLESSLSAWRNLVLSIERTAKILIRLRYQNWSEFSLGAHSFCWFYHVVAQIIWAFQRILLRARKPITNKINNQRQRI